ncbi:hypothetical protein C8J45_101779 [Sphingomonas sp. PP-CE-3G-477]|uniref:hypothetical protein n=1 Tax=Sphingomonas sp. PP-CE-3G-477 TaxID=2135660 RepID=UPI000D3BCA06|nr:hypothetical protein [Sphingomonas sp. PP-CE-3G-477]PTQ65917.1 hypothetical protein C8J45_101779 [Sphingomonas sp. PP-CE-3G-477]
MTSFTRLGTILLTGTACLALTACGGADDVASPGAGTVIITPPATPTPTPSTPTPTPTAITAAQFASTSGARSDGSITISADEQLAIVNAGTNNNVNGTNVLNGVYPIAATSATTATDPSSINPFFTSTNFVGALNGPTDTAFQGWTCNSSSAQFGGTTTASCTAVPSIGAYSAATSVCPTGTIDDGTNETSSAPATRRLCRLPTLITASLTLPKIAGVVYRLRGQTEVGTDVGTTGADTGVTLTIAPGVVVAADSTEVTADLLLVNRGSKISAVGTRDAPIIFTSQQNLTANGVSDATQGQWGGIILLGRAPVAVCATGTGPNNAGGTSTTCQLAIEGVTGRSYGGPTQADNSGTMQYVQIRYSGIAISDGNELQGLTLGGTGSATTIDHVQSHNSADDGIEIFGGTTNIKYFAVTGADDDGYDIDNGYRGFMQFIIAAQKITPATADSFSTEIDSNGAEDLLPRTFGQYSNFTFVQTAFAPAAIRQRGGSDMRFINGIVKTPATVACLNLVAQEASQADRSTIRAADASKQDQGPPIFTSVYFNCNGR